MPQPGRPPRGSNAGHGEVDLLPRIGIVPLPDLQLVHAAHEEQHALLADLDDGEVGGRGRPGEEGGVEGAGGGAGRDQLGGVGDRDISGYHLSSFLCLSEDYQVAVKARTALGEAGEARWDTIQLQRGDMLLMVDTSHHHGLPALPDFKDGLQGALFNLGTPDRAHKHHQPNTTHLDPTSPEEALHVAGDLSSWDFPGVDHVSLVGKGAVGRVGFWEGGAAEALLLLGGGTSGWVATSERQSWAPLPTLATMTPHGVIGWRSPT